jgi:GTPase
MLRKYIEEKQDIPTEIEEGNIEYKVRLDLKDIYSLKKMATQMIWRLNEGKNIYGKWIAHYYLGIDDDGSIANMNEDIINISLDIIKKVAEKCNSEITMIDKININNFYVAEVKIEKIFDENKIAKEIRICFMGDSNTGKTTTISNIVYNMTDDGNGHARNYIFKHKHERETGKTSSIKHDIIGFKNNSIINYKSLPMITWETITLTSEYVISLFDLPGCNKYVNTALYAYSGLKPHFNIILISLTETSIDENNFLKNSILNNDRIHILLTKNDLVDKKNIEDKISQIKNYVMLYSKKILMDYESKEINYNLTIPIDIIDNKKNNNNIFNSIIKNMITFKSKIDLYKNITSSVFNIIEVYQIPEKGSIVSGICISGFIEYNKIYYIGPIDKRFIPIKINTIHKKQVSCKKINYDETGSIEIGNIGEINISKNMIIISEDLLDKLNPEEILVNTKNINELKINNKYPIFIDNYSDIGLITNIIKLDDNYSITLKINPNSYIHENNKTCYIKTDNSIIISYINKN